MNEKYQGSHMSNDSRAVVALPHKTPMPPGFKNDSEWEGFKAQVMRARDTGLIPSSVKTIEMALVIALKGRELGLDPLYSLSQIYVVHGKAGLQAELMRALVFRKYPTARIEYKTLPEKKNEEATFLVQRPGGGEQFYSFTIQDAAEAGFVGRVKGPDGSVQYKALPGKQTWDNQRSVMLMARATSMAIRMAFPECVMGCGYTPDELSQVEVSAVPEQISDIDAKFSSPKPEPQMKIAEPAIVTQVKEAFPDAVEVQDMGEQVMIGGKFKGIKLKDKLNDFWYAYLQDVVNKLKLPGFPADKREEAEEICILLEAYLEGPR